MSGVYSNASCANGALRLPRPLSGCPGMSFLPRLARLPIQYTTTQYAMRVCVLCVILFDSSQIDRVPPGQTRPDCDDIQFARIRPVHNIARIPASRLIFHRVRLFPPCHFAVIRVNFIILNEYSFSQEFSAVVPVGDGIGASGRGRWNTTGIANPDPGRAGNPGAALRSIVRMRVFIFRSE